MFKWGIKSIEFTGGESISVEPNSTLIVLGPNNSGKSTGLMEITESLKGAHGEKVIKYLETFLEGTENDFLAWLKESYSFQDDSFLAARNRIHMSHINPVWKALQTGNYSNPLGIDFFGFLADNLQTLPRLQITESKRRINLNSPNPEEYIHILQINAQIMKEISQEVRKAFGVDLLINWYGAEVVWFHVGDNLPLPSNQEDI